MIPFDFMPIRVEIPEVQMKRGGIAFPRFTLDANGLPILIKDGHGAMLRLIERNGYGGRFEGHAVHVHPGNGLLSIHIAGVMTIDNKHHSMTLGHMESEHTKTGSLAEVAIFMDGARRRKPRTGKVAYGSGLFTLQLFRPTSV